MDGLDPRSLVRELADDLGWLEEHCRRQAELAAHSGQLRFAASVVRNGIGPFLYGQPNSPLHVVVVGGAGTGKSTIVNCLCGMVVAEANPQAGFTRHPIAFVSTNENLEWAAHPGFLGPLRRLDQPAPANRDEDVYQVRRVPAEAPGSLLGECVIWDCPDMTTWAAGGYVPRLIETAGLADVVVFVASDERYNDEVPTQFLHLLLRAGKPVVCVLTKMKEADAPSLIEHFRREVLTAHGLDAVVLAVPYLTPDELADPVKKASRFRIPLINQMAVAVSNSQSTRRRNVQYAVRYLSASEAGLLGSARGDLEALENWRLAVQAGQVEFDNRYRREFLTSDKYRRFDEALVRLLDLLELPGPTGRYISNALWVVRTPYRLARGAVQKMLARPEAVSLPEQKVLDGAFSAWLDALRTEAVRQSATHPVWKHIARGFNEGLGDLAHDRFTQGVRGFQLGLADEVERTSRAIFADLEQNPAMLNTLRGSKFGLDSLAIGATLVMGGINAHDLILVPLAASITHQLVEWLGARYVENQREQTKLRQQGLLAQYVSGPLAEWLAQWPTTDGSEYEKLQRVLRRVPANFRRLDEAVIRALQHPLH